MKAIQLRTFQHKAIDAIQNALKRNQKHIVVEIAVGCGKSLVLAKTVEMLSIEQSGRVLIITNRLELKAQIKDVLFNNYQDFVKIDKNSVTVETKQKVLNQRAINTEDYQFVVFFDVPVSETIYKALSCKQKTVLVFSSTSHQSTDALFAPNEVVFSYSYADAVNDGYLTPAMDTRALGPAAEAFTKQLLEQFGCSQIEFPSNPQDQRWDLVVHKSTHRIWVDCKTYKSQVVSPSAASSLLNGVVLRKRKQDIPQEDIILLVVFSQIPSLQKKEI